MSPERRTLKLEDHIHNGYLPIIARPNSPKTLIIGWDDSKKALRVDVHAKPDNNEANEEIVRFFSRLLKADISIKSGTRSKMKLLKIAAKSSTILE